MPISIDYVEVALLRIGGAQHDKTEESEAVGEHKLARFDAHPKQDAEKLALLAPARSRGMAVDEDHVDRIEEERRLLAQVARALLIQHILQVLDVTADELGLGVHEVLLPNKLLFDEDLEFGHTPDEVPWTARLYDQNFHLAL